MVCKAPVNQLRFGEFQTRPNRPTPGFDGGVRAQPTSQSSILLSHMVVHPPETQNSAGDLGCIVDDLLDGERLQRENIRFNPAHA